MQFNRRFIFFSIRWQRWHRVREQAISLFRQGEEGMRRMTPERTQQMTWNRRTTEAHSVNGNNYVTTVECLSLQRVVI